MCNSINDNLNPPDVLICECGIPEHQLLIYKDQYNFVESNYREIVIQPHLYNHHNFFKRLWIGIKYIFGYKCKYGHWDSMVITTMNYKPLKDAIDFLENKDN